MIDKDRKSPEEMVDKMPKELGNYLRAAKAMLIDPIAQMSPPPLSFPAPPPIKILRKVRSFDMSDEREMQAVFDDGWQIETSFSFEYSITIVFAKYVNLDTKFPVSD